MNLKPDSDYLIRFARWGLIKSPAVRWMTQKLVGRVLVRTILQMVYYDPQKISERVISEYTLPLQKPLFRSVVPFILSTDSESWFLETQSKVSKLTLPIHIIWGKHDKWIPLHRAYALRGLLHLPADHIRVIESAGHNPIEETPERVASILKEVL